jgi:type I site-specific restriction-modification system R (restriction) subunit
MGWRRARATSAEKVLRRLGGNWTFVIITDRQELDDQIAKLRHPG